MIIVFKNSKLKVNINIFKKVNCLTIYRKFALKKNWGLQRTLLKWYKKLNYIKYGP